MNIKKILCLIMALVLVFSLAACAEKPVDEEKDKQEENNEQDKQEETPDDSEDKNESEDPADKDDSGDGENTEEPAPLSYSTGLDEKGRFEGVTAKDLVTLPEYKGITIPDEVFVANDDTVNENVQTILDQYEEYEQITDPARLIADGDTANISYVGTIDGVEFAGGSTGEGGVEVTIGVTQYIDDFLEQLIGHGPGEQVIVDATFPDDYGKTDLAGKDAIFDVTINYIRGERIPKEFDESVAADFGYQSTEDLLEVIRENVIFDQKIAFVDSILDKATCEEVPQSVIDTVGNIVLCSCAEQATYYQVDLDTLLSLMGYETREAYLATVAEEIEQLAKKYLTIQAIAETEGLEVTAEDITEANSDSYIEVYGEPYVKFNLTRTLLIADFIFENKA